MIALSTVSILSLTVIGTIRLADQNIVRKVTPEHRLPFTSGLEKHKAVFSGECVTISGSDDAEQRMQAVDRFQKDPEVRVAICNIIAGGVGITLTAATHVIFQDLDWVPANHLQAEDRA